MLLDLVYFHEKSVREAAVIAGVSENTVKSRMYLGRKKLAVMLNAASIESESVTLVPSAEPSRRAVYGRLPEDSVCVAESS
jgi:predicted DNA-binding protein (UPF0251 family)